MIPWSKIHEKFLESYEKGQEIGLIWALGEFDKMSEENNIDVAKSWKNNDESICKHCGVNITFLETPIDNFWTHVRGVMKCEGRETFAWPQGVEDPPEFELTIREVETFEEDDRFSSFWPTSESGKIRVFGYSPDDEKLFMYHFTEEGLQETATLFTRDIWFTLTDAEVYEFVGEIEESKTNLKEDFIWFEPKVNGLHIVQCTCGGFLETGKSLDRLAKKAVRHMRRTGHALNPRGN